MVFSFSYREKLHSQADFNRVFKKGRKLENKAVKILALNRKDSLDMRRLGLVTSKKVGKAVARNRAKRRLREIFRTNKHLLESGLDLVFIIKPAAASLNYADLQRTVIDSLKNAGLYKEPCGNYQPV